MRQIANLIIIGAATPLFVAIGSSNQEVYERDRFRKGKGGAFGSGRVGVTEEQENYFEKLSLEENEFWGRFLQDENSLEPEPCDVKVDIACTTADGLDCTDIEAEPADKDECLMMIHLTYTVLNNGPTTETVSQLSRTLNGVLLDLTGELETTVLLPEESAQVKEQTVITVCAAITFTITADVNASPLNGEPCFDADEYSFLPKVICDCDCEVVIDCKTTEGGISCKQIPPAETVGDCILNVTYTYTVWNYGSADSKIVTLERTRNGEFKNLTDDLTQMVLFPGENTQVDEIETINICEGTNFRTEAYLVTNCLHCLSRPDRALREVQAKKGLYKWQPHLNRELQIKEQQLLQV